MVGNRSLPFLVCLLLALAGWPAAALAQVSAAIHTPSPQPRSNAPIAVDIDLIFKPLGPENFLEGTLLLTVSDSGQVLAQCRSTPLALAVGTQTIHLLIPPIATYSKSLDLQPIFMAKDGSAMRLDATELAAAPPLARGSVLAVSDPWTGSGDHYGELTSLLRVEQFDPDAKVSVKTGPPTGTPGAAPARAINTFPARIRPEDLPRDGLSYCAFDTLLAAGQGLAMLDQRRLDAIAQWTDAGGSLCVVADAPISPAHVAWLNRLAASANSTVHFFADDRGMLGWPDAQAGRPLLLRPGLGRLVVATQAPREDEASASPAWRSAAAFLMKFSRQSSDQAVANGQWTSPPKPSPDPNAGITMGSPVIVTGPNGQSTYGYPGQPYLGSSFETTPRGGIGIEVSGVLNTALAPPAVRPVPISVIAALLTLFVLAIGPGDYFLLGAIRRRRWTWVLMPLLAVAATVVMARTSSHYLGRTDIRRAIAVIDLGPGGRPLRSSRYELSFTAARRQIITPRAGQLWTTLPLRGGGPFEYRVAESLNVMARSNVPPAIVDGRFPNQFISTEQTNQWTSQLSRATAFSPQDDPPALDWDASDPAQAVAKFNQPAVGPRVVAVWLLHLNKIKLIYGNPPGWNHQDPSQDEYQPFSTITHIPTESDANDEQGVPLLPSMRWVKEISTHQPEGIFEVVSQLSPQGGDFFEDLPLLDPTDPAQYLLAALVVDGDNYKLYRRLYVTQD